MKKIENIQNLDDIETQLKKDGHTFDNGEVVFEGMPDGIASEKDKINFLKKCEIVYFDDKKIYGINIDELGDYEVVDFKIRRELQEFIEENISNESKEVEKNTKETIEEDDDNNEFIYQGEKKLIDILPNYYAGEIQTGWSHHFVDEYIEFDDGFVTTVNFENHQVIYHVYVDEDARGQGKGKQMLINLFKQGIQVVFNPNFEMCNLLMALEQDEEITFQVIEPDKTSGCYLPEFSKK